MRILFVEDDPLNRRVVKDMLQTVGAELVEAEDAESGLRMIDEQSFEVVLMDLRMPGMDGLTAIRHIRERTDAKSMLPIIVVTADTALTIREDCMGGGADEVILKPVAMKQLFTVMGRLMVEAKRRAAA
ncbi:MAG: response regulator [Sphingomonas bacterium]|nr:response regulator [Sphingomonas bacterium]MDB5719005.1 response regulator [Sphingomonas bacterium]